MTKQVLGDLIVSSREQMYRIAKTILYSDDDCADAISEAIVKAFTKIGTLKKDAFAKTWLMRILINECYAVYYDVTGGSRNNNYIPEIGAHESTVVHMAWLVEEEKLDKLFLSVNGDTGYEFTDAELETGLVDLRK